MSKSRGYRLALWAVVAGVAPYLFEGAMPDRDFVFVHRPGLLLFLAASCASTHSLFGVGESR